jgi:hypothetical protein
MYGFPLSRTALCKQESCPGPAELESLLPLPGTNGNNLTMGKKRPMAPFALVFYINYFFIAVEKMLFLQKTVNEM